MSTDWGEQSGTKSGTQVLSMSGIEPGTTEQLSQGSAQGMSEDVHCTVVYMGRELESLLLSLWRNACAKCSECTQGLFCSS